MIRFTTPSLYTSREEAPLDRMGARCALWRRGASLALSGIET